MRRTRGRRGHDHGLGGRARDRLLSSYADVAGLDVDALAAASRLVELRILATGAEWQARAGLDAEIPTTLHRLASTLAHF